MANTLPNLGTAIALSADALTAYDGGDDEALLTALNAQTIKRTTLGRASVAGMADASPELASAFLATIKGTIDSLQQGTIEQQAQAELFQSFRDRFKNNHDGLDFANEQLRSHLTAILTSASWPAEQIAAVLALGYVHVSPMQYVFNRDGTEQDIADYHSIVSKEKARQDYESGLLDFLQSPVNDGDRAGIATALRAMADWMIR